jgi:hypothetical protein
MKFFSTLTLFVGLPSTVAFADMNLESRSQLTAKIAKLEGQLANAIKPEHVHHDHIITNSPSTAPSGSPTTPPCDAYSVGQCPTGRCSVYYAKCTVTANCDVDADQCKSPCVLVLGDYDYYGDGPDFYAGTPDWTDDFCSYPSQDAACSDFDASSGLCPTDRCYFDDEVLICKELPCNTYSRDECPDAFCYYENGCKSNQHAKSCKFNDESQCKYLSTYCTWDPNATKLSQQCLCTSDIGGSPGCHP